jgi:M6 family metalloprotease-like protein
MPTIALAVLAACTLAGPGLAPAAASGLPDAGPELAAAAVTADSSGLQLENSFVSALGWVKPGEAYPSRIILKNTASSPSGPATVTVSTPTGTSITNAHSTSGSASYTADSATWTVPSVPAATEAGPGEATLVLEQQAKTLRQVPTLVWRDLSTTATLSADGASSTAQSHGPKVIPPNGAYDTARYGDRPFPVVPVEFRDRAYQAGHDGGDLAKVINDPELPGSTFNLYQEMSLGQLFPHGTVPSDGIASADFTSYEPGFDFTDQDPATTNTCAGGVTQNAVLPAAPGTVGGLTYTERITNGVYNLPGNTAYYGSDGNGSAVVGSLTGQSALMQIDSGCGPTSKVVWDAAAISDPEIDFSDYDTDKDGVVDFFMVVFAGCGGNGSSQLSLPGDPVGACPYGDITYDNIWPHSSSLEYYYTDPATGLTGYTTDDQLRDLEDRPLYYTSAQRREKTTEVTDWPVYVRIGPYNLNPETAIDKASVISHEYGHSLGLPDFYSLGGRETYGDWNLMATDKSQNMDAYSRQELGWVVPEVLDGGTSSTVTDMPDSKQDTGVIHWRTPDGTPYTLVDGQDGVVHNSRMYAAKLPGRNLLDPAKFQTGDGATPLHAWYGGSGNDFGCTSDGGGHNLDLAIPGVSDLPAGSTVNLSLKSMFDIEWDFDYGFVLTSTDGGQNFTSNPSTRPTHPTTTTSNANANGCQATYSNGITGSSDSYRAGTEATDRLLGNYPESSFITDSFDISELAGASLPVLRFSYATDPGLARPGWFVDDVKVTATLPDGSTRDLLVTDFENGDMDETDPRVFNGGCQGDTPAGAQCTTGWQFVKAGDEASFDHAYFLEMRDRSGFDLDGHGQIDRDPIGFEAGLYLSYTDEAHGYGNAGTDDPPAQSPLDATPTPGSETPDLNDAAFTAAADRSSYSDSGEGHTDNYTDPAEQEVDSRYPDVANPWRFQYDCLGFTVTRLVGAGLGPETSDGDLTGDVSFDMGQGCGDFNYGYTAADLAPNTAPTASVTPASTTVAPGSSVTLDASGSTDAETPNDLDYSWDVDGDGVKDLSGPVVQRTYDTAGTYTATVTVTDPSGATDTAEAVVTVTKKKGHNKPPRAHSTVSPTSPVVGQQVTMDASSSTDEETASRDLTYRWNLHNGGSAVDRTGRHATARFGSTGVHRVTLTVVDADGATSSVTRDVTVRREIRCESRAVSRSGGWRLATPSRDNGWGRYCDSRASGSGANSMTATFSGGRLTVLGLRGKAGGTARVLVDGVRVGTVGFASTTSSPQVRSLGTFTGLGAGQHRVTLVVSRGAAFVEGFVVDR